MAQWLQENPEVCERTWFSDEAHFWLCGHVNSRNVMYWSDKRADKVLHQPLHSKKVTVWAAMRQGQPPIGSFFFEDENEEAVTITTERYINLALTPFWEAIGLRTPAWNTCRGTVGPTRRRDATYGQCHTNVATDPLPWETRQPEYEGAVGPHSLDL